MTHLKGHTALPWTIQPGVYDINPETATEFPHGPEVVGNDGEIVAYLNLYGENDAELIVLACNDRPALLERLDRAESALRAARSAIASLDQAALGGHKANHPEDEGYYFRDELLAHIDAALRAASITEK